MKPKKLQKPLVLNKQTITNLSKRSASKVKGGACTYPPTGCDSIVRYCCSVNPNTCTLIPFCDTETNGCYTCDCLHPGE